MWVQSWPPVALSGTGWLDVNRTARFGYTAILLARRFVVRDEPKIKPRAAL